jgi:glycosyltransferase involved in cell wall biosynthesis
MSELGSVFYCALCRSGSPAANAIQTIQMCDAFSQLASHVDVVMRRPNSQDSVRRLDPAFQVLTIDVGNSRASTWLYSVRAFGAFRRLSRSRKYDFVYSRSVIFCFLAAFARNGSIALELHTGIRGRLEVLVVRILMRRHVNFICISQSIERELKLINPQYDRILVAPDGHGFPISAESEVGPSARSPMKVGYFGSLTPQKGSDLLRALFKRVEKMDFHVFSKETGLLLAGPNLKEYRYLQPQDVYKKMLEMDVFLLPIVPQGGDDRISDYTSPLKLYEYLAVGRPILVSDVPVLRAELNESMVFFCNDTDSFVEALSVVNQDRESARAKARAGLALAHERTWVLRASRILKFCGF